MLINLLNLYFSIYNLKYILKDPENANRRLPTYDYETLACPREIMTRSQDETECTCTICSIGKMNGLKYKTYLKTNVITPGRSRNNELSVPVTVKLCDFCYSEIGKGKPHNCNVTEKHDNLVQLVTNNNSEKICEQVTSKLLKNIYDVNGTSTRGGSVKLATKGTPLQVQLGTNNNNKHNKAFTLEEMNSLQITRNFSDKDTLAVANFIRVKKGRSSIEPHLQQYLTDRNSNLDQMFELKEMTLKKKLKLKKSKEGIKDETIELDENGNTQNLDENNHFDIKRPGIFVKNVKEFTEMVVTARNIDPESHIIQFGFDDGQGILKLMEIIKSTDLDEQETNKKSINNQMVSVIAQVKCCQVKSCS